MPKFKIDKLKENVKEIRKLANKPFQEQYITIKSFNNIF